MHSLVSILLLAVTLPGLAALGGFEGSPHDFAVPTKDGRIGCTACHHPHTPIGKTARWQIGAERTRPFSLYRARTGLPHETTLLCLGCHDGAIANQIPVASRQLIVSQVGRSHAVTNGRLSAPLGSHPVGVAYRPRRPKFVSKATVEADRAIRLPGGQVECISCHDPHGTAGFKPLLVKPNRRSGLCLSCHRL